MKDKSAKSNDQCREFAEKIPGFLASSLPETDFLAMEAHRQECAACAKLLFDEERVMRLMAEIPEVNVPPDFRDRVVRAWRLKRDRVQNSIPFSTLRYVQIIFALFLIAVLSLPASRISLLSAASDLSSAINNLPPEYRQGVQISLRYRATRNLSRLCKHGSDSFSNGSRISEARSLPGPPGFRNFDNFRFRGLDLAMANKKSSVRHHFWR